MKSKTVSKKDFMPTRIMKQDPNSKNLINPNTKLYKRAATHSLDKSLKKRVSGSYDGRVKKDATLL